jgi:predicted transcriptional regulator
MNETEARVTNSDQADELQVKRPCRSLAGMGTFELPVSSKFRMTTREIAELLDTEHEIIYKRADHLFDMGLIDDCLQGAREYYKDEEGNEKPLYKLDFRATMLVISGYSTERCLLVIDRWMEANSDTAPVSKQNVKALHSLLSSQWDWFQQAYEDQQKAHDKFVKAHNVFRDVMLPMTSLLHEVESQYP